MEDLQVAMESVVKGKKIADQCPMRPKYHFLAPAFWMNDPNGPIFYMNEYHLFYQHDPFKVDGTTNKKYWGHTISKDLVYWEHLPIALAPSYELGENGCWSGCCVNNDGTPTIIYTSVGPNKLPKNNAEQWLATSSDDMLTWQKHPKNPIMTSDLHGTLKIHDWRDPYVWKENNAWYMVLGGHLKFVKGTPKKTVVLLYKSKDLINWQFLHILCEGKKRNLGKNWECPNFFPLGDKHILIVSPHKKVIYNIGTYKTNDFNPGEWKILDHGKCFYAPNTLVEKNGRVILWGWIIGGGTGGWNGCLTLPRILTLGLDGTLRVKPAPEFQKLRDTHEHLENISITPQSSIILGRFIDLNLEICAKFEFGDVASFGFKLFQSSEYDQGEIIEFDALNCKIRAGKEVGKLKSVEGKKLVDFHVFVDKSVIEIFINNQECLTSRIYPKDNNSNLFKIFAKNGKVKLQSLDLWTLKSIW